MIKWTKEGANLIRGYSNYSFLGATLFQCIFLISSLPFCKVCLKCLTAELEIGITCLIFIIAQLPLKYYQKESEKHILMIWTKVQDFQTKDNSQRNKNNELNYWAGFFKVWCETVFTRKRYPSHDLLSSFPALIWVYQYLACPFSVHSLVIRS